MHSYRAVSVLERSSGEFEMLTAHPASVVQKRDLHVGGLGVTASGALAAVTDPFFDATDSWVDRARDAVRDADDYVHDRPWTALALVAVIGLTAGYLLARRSST
jgi:ElaB/YqjD/DUF883 family membrane-anchored ribosome-binding protein